MFNIDSKPRYIHDCDKCLFLGCYKEFDIYWCQDSTSIAGGSLIARYGSEGPQYESSPVSMLMYADYQGNPNDVKTFYNRPLFKAAQYLLYKGYIRIHVNTKALEEDKDLFEDLWNMRKKS